MTTEQARNAIYRAQDVTIEAQRICPDGATQDKLIEVRTVLNDALLALELLEHALIRAES